MDGYGYTPIPPAEASCIIAHLFVELAPPCSCCKREDGVIVIQGTAYDGTGEGVVGPEGVLAPLEAVREVGRALDGLHAVAHGRGVVPLPAAGLAVCFV